MRNHEFDKMISRARSVLMTTTERETQRRSFAYGNSKIDNDHITREMINHEAAAPFKRGTLISLLTPRRLRRQPRKDPQNA
jgi:hypothetical protein